ncbi:IS1 family transposase, partial [Salmonella enterica subsp. enterica]
PSEIHLVGKIFTQRIERHNLNLRIYSINLKMHNKM